MSIAHANVAFSGDEQNGITITKETSVVKSLKKNESEQPQKAELIGPILPKKYESTKNLEKKASEEEVKVEKEQLAAETKIKNKEAKKQSKPLNLLGSFLETEEESVVTPVNLSETGNKSESDKRLTIIPNGQTLLLRPKVGPLLFDQDIYALKDNDQLYVSLEDAIDILGVAVDFDSDQLAGNGWFFREDWRIDIDLNNRKVVSRGQEFDVEPENLVLRDNNIFIAQSDFEKWFNVQLLPDISQQYMIVESEYPLPSVARQLRKQKQISKTRSANEAQLPRVEADNSWLDINMANIRLTGRYRKAPDVDTTYYGQNIAAVEGQFINHDAYVLTAADTEDGLDSVVARLSKRDEDPVLLGPLKARSYVLGDTTTTRIPLTGGARQELGMRISNSELQNTNFQTTNIEGDAIPGWDVELYRNSILSGTQTVGNDGRYQFAEIPLFVGDNKFEVFFYGPQGEIRSEEINVPVNRNLLRKQDMTYDVSATLSNTRTLSKPSSRDVDRETPHIAARFNKYLGNSLTYLGLRHRSVEGDEKTFGAVGFTSTFQNTIIDGNVGIDDKANAAAQLSARKNIFDWNTSLLAAVQSDEYAPESTVSAQTLKFAGNAQRTFQYAPGFNTGVALRGEYTENGNNQEVTTGVLGLSQQLKNLSLSNTVFYEDTQAALESNDRERVTNTFSARANFGKYFVRGGVDYNVKPEGHVDKYFSQINYRPSDRLTTDFILDHEPDRHFTEGRLNVSYTHDNFKTSPFIEVDSDDEIFAGVNLNVNFVDTPNEILPKMTGKTVIGRGMVSSFVYHDKNGNLVYDAQDEILPDVTVQSVNVRRRVETNAEGYALIDDLPSSRATDIVIDEETLPDPYMVSAFEGSSVFPDPGKIVELEFPIHMSGELDGTISVKRKDGTVDPAKFIKVSLVPLDSVQKKTIEMESAFDGFYVGTRIPAGDYLMVVSSETTKKYKAASPPPRILKISHQGETLYGMDIMLQQSSVDVPVKIAHVDASRDSMNIPANKPLYSLLVSRAAKSKLLSVLQKFSHRSFDSDLMKDLVKINMNRPNDQQFIRYMLQGNNAEDAYKRCQNLTLQGTKCEMEVLIRPKEQKYLKTASR